MTNKPAQPQLERINFSSAGAKSPAQRKREAALVEELRSIAKSIEFQIGTDRSPEARAANTIENLREMLQVARDWIKNTNAVTAQEMADNIDALLSISAQ